MLPPSLTDWLPENHLVWTVLGAVEQMDLDRFTDAYRLGGAGRAAYDPAMLVALLLYSYARGIRSSRRIERACWEDVAFRVIACQQTPDHSTIAEFRRRHEFDIAELFDQVLGLCREAGLVSVGVITIDGTKIKANASMDQNRDYRQIALEILREAEETDRREDEQFGDARGDELPEQLRTAEGRKAALAEAKRRIAERKRQSEEQPSENRPLDDEAAEEKAEEDQAEERGVIDPQPLVSGHGGRREWFRAGRRQLEDHRAQQGRPIGRDREDRLFDAAGRLEQNREAELTANERYEQWRAQGKMRNGRRLHSNGLKPYVPPELPDGVVNISDPDSRVMRTQGTPPRQAYNAQAAVNDRQIILAAEVTVDAADFGRLEPMLETTLDGLRRVGVAEQPDVLLADAGYWHTAQMQAIRDRGIEVLAPPDGNMRDGIRPGWEGGPYQQMRDTLQTDRGRELYAQRKTTIEPVFGQIKHNRHIERFMRRGRSAARSEWRLVAATHNLLKLHNHWIANTA